jgi:nucleoside-diphosphate-sugar epimerase
MIVAVTGANGFIGRHLCAAFRDAGHDVREIVRRDLAEGLDRKLADADVVVHAAGATRAPTRDALRTSIVALTGTVIAAAKRARIGRFVFVSSQAAAGPASNRAKPVVESDPPAPIEEYGRSKRDAEGLVSACGLPFTIVRPAAVYGPGDRDFLPLYRLGRDGMAIHPGNRDQWISIVHVQDCVAGILAASSTLRAVGGTYFLANDEPVQWRTMFELVRAASGARRLVDLEIPMLIVESAAQLGDLAARVSGHAGLLTSEKIALGKPRFWICSNERAKRELGFAPRVALRDGIADAYRWYAANGRL